MVLFRSTNVKELNQIWTFTLQNYVKEIMGKIHVHNKLEMSMSPLSGVVTHDSLNNFVTEFIQQYFQCICIVQR